MTDIEKHSSAEEEEAVSSFHVGDSTGIYIFTGPWSKNAVCHWTDLNRTDNSFYDYVGTIRIIDGAIDAHSLPGETIDMPGGAVPVTEAADTILGVISALNGGKEIRNVSWNVYRMG